MPGQVQVPSAGPRTQLVGWEYLGGQTLTNPTDQALTLPQSVSAIVISSETAACYYAINGAIASTISPGYIPTDGMQAIGPLSGGLTGVRVHGPTAVVHVQYFREV